MYDHLYQRGYVREVPGAPMCACVEQMPVVTRADCTQTDVQERWELHIEGFLRVSVADVRVSFKSCQGANGRNNDLKAYFERLVNEGDATRADFSTLQETLVGPRNCPTATADFLSEVNKSLPPPKPVQHPPLTIREGTSYLFSIPSFSLSLANQMPTNRSKQILEAR